MDIINEVSKKARFITNKVGSINEKIKLSISKLSIRVKNSINEFIYQNNYQIRFDKNTTFLKSKNLSIRNKGENDVNNEKVEAKITNDKKSPLKEKQNILNNIELPNGDLIPIDEAINNIHLSKQDSILKSKLSLIDYITDRQFKSSANNSIKSSSEFNSHFISSNLDNKNEYNYVKFGSYEDTSNLDNKNEYNYVKFGSYENTSNLDNKNEYNYVKFGGYENTSNLKYNSMNDGYLIMTKSKSISENMDDKFNPNVSKNVIPSEKESFKSFLLDITKNISLLDRLSDGENSYGYVFLAKVANYLDDYNRDKEHKKTDYFNKEDYLKKMETSDYFFNLNKKINNIIYLQYLKKEQSNDESGVIDKITATDNSNLNEVEHLKEAEKQKEVFDGHDKLNENNDDSFNEFLSEIDEQLNISNKNKKLTLDELLKKMKK
ncbi:hypothetical protein QSH14_14870 [Proteus faecis]|uniref:Uncharacterized protein n=1 Tax=Proteus faecis TaxID=2050967 RepID=A0AAW7CSZ0_9GAMM|nr:hypothetical protein [Proteus faecis]MDL5168428.1 hypothetical protein [Proteus faecis]MDL5276413.1 hypothetical protein [Proteus faecis]MDL5279980.1 hypothetical protein [Proteus faecis]MDL5308983.1 hypothetical protein [Proteus faecis]MDL5312465.1 hypothetical protein [Proteus faecis]